MEMAELQRIPLIKSMLEKFLTLFFLALPKDEQINMIMQVMDKDSNNCSCKFQSIHHKRFSKVNINIRGRKTSDSILIFSASKIFVIHIDYLMMFYVN